MARLPALLLAASALAAAAPPAAADPFTGNFNDLLVELNDRDADLPPTGLTKEQRKGRRALNRAFRALAADSKDLAGDLAMARKMAAALEAGYPGDGVIAGLLSGLNDALGLGVIAGRDELEVSIALAAEGRLKDRALARLAAADALLADAGAAATQGLRARLLERAHRTSLQGSRLAEKAGPGGSTGSSSMSATVNGSPWAANDSFGTAVSGLAHVSESLAGVRKILVAGRRILPNGASPPLPGDTSRIQITLQSVSVNVAPGTFPVGTTDGINASATWTFEAEDGAFQQAVAVSGSIVLTSLTLKAGSVDAAGTFDFSFYDGVADATFPVASGTFEVFDLPRSTVP